MIELYMAHSAESVCKYFSASLHCQTFAVLLHIVLQALCTKSTYCVVVELVFLQKVLGACIRDQWLPGMRSVTVV